MVRKSWVTTLRPIFLAITLAHLAGNAPESGTVGVFYSRLRTSF